MQQQAGIRPHQHPAVTEGRESPMGKMLVKCCSCERWHDMPSREYECMADSDGVASRELTVLQVIERLH